MATTLALLDELVAENKINENTYINLTNTLKIDFKTKFELKDKLQIYYDGLTKFDDSYVGTIELFKECVSWLRKHTTDHKLIQELIDELPESREFYYCDECTYLCYGRESCSCEDEEALNQIESDDDSESESDNENYLTIRNNMHTICLGWCENDMCMDTRHYIKPNFTRFCRNCDAEYIVYHSSA